MSLNIQQIRFIMGRVHVGTSNRNVIRNFRERIARGNPGKMGRAYRKDRHDVYRAALAEHASNGGLYNYVMRGLR